MLSPTLVMEPDSQGVLRWLPRVGQQGAGREVEMNTLLWAPALGPSVWADGHQRRDLGVLDLSSLQVPGEPWGVQGLGASLCRVPWVPPRSQEGRCLLSYWVLLCACGGPGGGVAVFAVCLAGEP